LSALCCKQWLNISNKSSTAQTTSRGWLYVRPLPAARAEPFTGVMLPSSKRVQQHCFLLIHNTDIIIMNTLLPLLKWLTTLFQ